MSQKLQPIRGMKDILPVDHKRVDAILGICNQSSSNYGFKKISTPILEHIGVFNRTLGESSDVISKEMYNFTDRSGDSVTLRPEYTAGVMRAVISNNLHMELPLRLFSFGPCFRYDRPQAGRQRQFHHLNFEFIGEKGPYIDAEMLSLVSDICEKLGISSFVKLELNSLGSSESRKSYLRILEEYFSDNKDKLSEDSLQRLTKNSLRILDSKNPGDQVLVANAPLVSDYYDNESKEYFDELREILKVMQVNYVLNPRLVRGLDYYCHTAFECTTDRIGAQSSILGGGRYDGLSKIMGGPDISACGFAAGLERLLLVSSIQGETNRPIILMPIGDNNINPAIKIMNRLRSENKIALTEYKGKVTKRMNNANKAEASHVIFVGDEEVAQQKYKVKDMDSGNESLYSLEEIISL